MIKPRICLIYTGGTIGMARTETSGGGYILQPPKNPEEFLKSLNAETEIDKIATLEFVSLMNKDSTNMVPADWKLMAEAVYTRRNHGFDGFVIAHGTDTMHFSASALAFAFGRNLNFPIVFTGAQTTPDVAHGDARVNLLRAMRVACEDLAEVVVAFGDYVFRGCRVQKKDEKRFDAFESPAEFPLGYITEEIVLNPDCDKKIDRPPIEFRPDFSDGVVQISLIPGLKPKLLLPILNNRECRGVVLQSFGAGNVPNEGEYSFEYFIRQATEKGIPVVIASQFPANSTLHSHYAPGVAAVEAGAIPTGNMTNAAATVKFRWVLSQVDGSIERGELAVAEKLRKVREMMETVYVHEMTKVKPKSNP